MTQREYLKINSLDLVIMSELKKETEKYKKQTQIINYTAKFFIENKNYLQQKFNSDGNKLEKSLFLEVKKGIEILINTYEINTTTPLNKEILDNNPVLYDWITTNYNPNITLPEVEATINPKGREIISKFNRYKLIDDIEIRDADSVSNTKQLLDRIESSRNRRNMKTKYFKRILNSDKAEGFLDYIKQRLSNNNSRQS